MSNPDMMEALQALAVEKGISVETLLEALADALESAYKRMPERRRGRLVAIDLETGDIRVIAQELDEDGDVVARVGRHARRLRPHRRADREAGDPASASARPSAR